MTPEDKQALKNLGWAFCFIVIIAVVIAFILKAIGFM
jgi:hypothetical protein